MSNIMSNIMSDTMSDTHNPETLATVSNAVAAMHRKFNIPGDVVFKATADLDDEARNSIRGMHAYAADNDLSLAELEKLLKISDTTIGLVFRGKYEAKLDNVVKTFSDFLKLHEERKSSRRLPFIETSLSDRIWQVCDRAREFQRIAFLFSDAQIGKTEALQEYQRRNNHGSTIYVEVPTGGTLTIFCHKLAERLKIGTTQRFLDLRRRILESFDDRMLLIVDEAHRAIPSPTVSMRSLDTIEFIREIFNERKCGVVFCATNVFRDAMEQGAVQLILKQTRRRRLCSMPLPTEPSPADLNTFSAAYGLPPASGRAKELQDRVIENEALGMWLLILRIANKLASSRKKNLTWEHVIHAEAGLKAMETAV